MDKRTGFKWVAILEGISFLVLLGIAMPLKYIWGEPWLTRQVGMAHGVLFIGYVLAVFRVREDWGWTTRQTMLALILSCVPFGTWYVTGKMIPGRA